jgi:hypothetical protein
MKKVIAVIEIVIIIAVTASAFRNESRLAVIIAVYGMAAWLMVYGIWYYCIKD